jgi:nicotinamidase-related amidase
MKTPFHEIFDEAAIGLPSFGTLNSLMQKASAEKLRPASEDKQKVLFLAIDMQNDFLERGELAVPGSHQDVARAARFLYRHLEKITQVAYSLDTHQPLQIFHPCWWTDAEGNHPEPLTIITRDDVEKGKWRAVVHPKESLAYVTHLEQQSKKELCIWPYHCLEGSFGAALESQFARMVFFHALARKSTPLRIVKGKEPLSEMYGIFKPEHGPCSEEQLALLNRLREYDRILIVGEAKSHCVLESLGQMLEHYADDREVTSRIAVLADCMSSIPGFEEQTEKTLAKWQDDYGITIASSASFSL